MQAALSALAARDVAWDLGQREHDFPSDAYGARQATQVAFEAYREARCAYVTAWMACMMQATGEHVLWLEERIEGY